MTQINFQQIRQQELEKANSCWNVHNQYKNYTLQELQKVSADDRVPWHTMAINITGDLNVGTIIRTSHCLGASSVIVVGRTKLDRRSLVGAENYITVEKHRTMDNDFKLDVNEVFNIFNEKNLVPIFCESGGLPLTKVNWKTRIEAMNNRSCQPCLVMGNESGGIPADLLQLEDVIPNSFTVSIPQRGVIRSFNVAVAHSIIAGHMCNNMGWI